MQLSEFLEKIKKTSNSIEFDQVIQIIEENYVYVPTEFDNGEINNAAGENEGSCKIFAFAMLNSLSEQQTLACFGHYYRDDVLKHPEASDHANIRSFIKYGWSAIKFTGQALNPKF